ncbi:hypothetical protein AC230_00205 [Streptomyces caatingaensis]|uniref:Uncharacterized protein n=1 Tax=Streptomyces caatingaensis TaxID=1678637 RepID=A0A0K9XM70_9ACTN|nr:hypothetical protein AC230_00205 [Streptomyces caatingaensis]
MRPAPSRREGVLRQVARHDDALHLVGALVDLGDLRVAHHPLQRVVARVAVAAEQLDRVGGDLHGGVGGVALGGGAEEGQVAVGALGLGGGRVGQLPGRLQLHRHVGEHELDALEVADRPAELLLDSTDLDGAVVTSDVSHTQCDHATYFSGTWRSPHPQERTCEHGQGRGEIRRIKVCTVNSLLFPGVQTALQRSHEAATGQKDADCLGEEDARQSEKFGHFPMKWSG